MKRPHAAPAHPGDDAHPAGGLHHVPHLLDFHDLRRPECLAFWSLMAVCFGIGFLPKRQHAGAA